jgi:hypothetical protein
MAIYPENHCRYFGLNFRILCQALSKELSVV